MIKICFIVFFTYSFGFSEAGPLGSLFGKVLSEKDHQPIDACSLLILPLDTLVRTNIEGSFYVEGLPTGSYTLEVAAPGFVKSIRTRVSVVSGRAEEIQIELKPEQNAFSEVLTLSDKVVTQKSSTGLRARGHETVGTYRMTRQEVLASTGTLLDISRAMQFLPGMTRNNDQSTNLIVRGGSPDEVAYLVDGIPLFSINHFEFGRNKRGEIGNINMYFLDHIDFHNGAFAARYQDKMSGVMDIIFKKGDPRRHTGMVIVDAAGTGGVLEGPIYNFGNNSGKYKGTYGATFRYSSLGLLDKSGVIDFGGVPQYQNGHVKLNYQVGRSNWNFNLLAANDEFVGDGISNSYQNTVGPQGQYSALRGSLYKEDSYTENTFTSLRWSRPWEKSSTSIYSAFNTRLENGKSQDSIFLISQDTALFPEYEYESLDESSEGTRVLYGVDQKHFLTDEITLQYGAYHEYNILRHERDNREILYFSNTPNYSWPGLIADTLVADLDQYSGKGSYFNFSVYSELLYQRKMFDLYFGGRFLYDEFMEDYEIGPRVGIKFYLGEHVFKYAGGFHTQSEVHDLFAVENHPKQLPVSVHNVVGWERTFKYGILSGIELFNKETYHVTRFRQNPQKPPLGKTLSRGFDVQIKKSLLKSLWSTSAYTYTWNREWFQEKWIKTIYSVPHSFTSALGFDFHKKLSGSVRYSYATGSPHARAVLDPNTGRTFYEFDLNERYADYHRLDLRLDYRHYFKRMSLAAFIEITNVLDHHNEFVWFNGTGKAEGWTRFPVGGLTLSF